jgi:hypothetical protein
MDEVFLSWPDLTNQPIGNLDVDFHRWQQLCPGGQHVLCSYVVVTLDSVIEGLPLPVGTSVQKAELAILMQALQLTAGV